MLQDLSNALKSWNTDKKSEKLSGAAEEADILLAIENKIPILKSYIEKIEAQNQDLQEIFDLAYADCHFIMGFGQIIGSKKIIHLGMLAELIADSARYFQTYSNYSMSYLFGLLLEKLDQVVIDLKKSQSTSLDITDVVSECGIYLTKPIAEILKKSTEKREAKVANIKELQEQATKERSKAPSPAENTKITSEKIEVLEDEQDEV